MSSARTLMLKRYSALPLLFCAGAFLGAIRTASAAITTSGDANFRPEPGGIVIQTGEFDTCTIAFERPAPISDRSFQLVRLVRDAPVGPLPGPQNQQPGDSVALLVTLQPNTQLWIPVTGGVEGSAARIEVPTGKVRTLENLDRALTGLLPDRLELRQGEVWEEFRAGQVDTTTSSGASIRPLTPGSTTLNVRLSGEGRTTLTVARGIGQLASAGRAQPVPAEMQSHADRDQPPTPPRPVLVNVPFIIAWPDDVPVLTSPQAREEVNRHLGSPTAYASLVFALLREGRVDQAVREARSAVKLPGEPWRTRFLLGVALAEQGQLDRAQRELERALQELDREQGRYYRGEALGLLARIYGAQGRWSKAQEVAQQAQELGSGAARAALGEVYWRSGRLKEATAEYLRSLEQSGWTSGKQPEPGHLLALLQLARVYLDLNDLPAALQYALAAVDAAPASSEAHAVLGLVYDRQDNRLQAQREYLEALFLSPDNSLARLGLVTSFTPESAGFFESGSERLAERAQALLRDPAVLQQLFEPGKTAELSSSGGDDAIGALRFLHRGQFSRGRINDLATARGWSDDGYRDNAGTHFRELQSDIAAQPAAGSHVLFQYLSQRLNGGLPGTEEMPTRKVEARRHRRDINVSLRQYLGADTDLWLGHGARLIDNNRTNPGEEFFASRLHRTQHVSELRIDHRRGPYRLSYGFAAIRSQINGLNEHDLRLDRTGIDPIERQVGEETGRLRDRMHWLNGEYRIADRGTVVLGARRQATRDNFVELEYDNTGILRFVENDSERDEWLPHGMLSYSSGRRSVLRVRAFQTRARFAGSLFMPAEVFLVARPTNVSPNGILKTYGVEYERRFSLQTFAQVFFQHDSITGLNLQPALDQMFAIPSESISRAEARLAGLGLEHQITPELSSVMSVSHAVVTNRTRVIPVRGPDQLPGATQPNPSYGHDVPLSPRWQGMIGLNYTDRSGTKLRLIGNYRSRQFADWDTFQSTRFQPTKRRRFASQTWFDLRLAKEERSLASEYSLTVTNLFNQRVLDWPGLPRRGRFWMLTFARRW